MRALILSVADKRHMTMVSPYIEYLENRDISYDIIRANRYDASAPTVLINDERYRTVYEIKLIFEPEVSKIKKIFYFLWFRLTALRIIKTKTYDYVIVWNENTAALFYDILKKKFKNRYCINIRDYYPKFIEKFVIDSGNNAQFITVVSHESREFNMFPKEKVICLYNQDMELRKQWKYKTTKRADNQPIRLTHLGFYSKARYASDKILDLFGNDERFVLQFYGHGFDTEFLSKVKRSRVNNVQIGGAFDYNKTIEYLQETDIINSFYNRSKEPGYSSAFGIKHSYTPLLCIPSLADEDSAWGRMSKLYGLAYLVNDNNIETLPDDLFKWYRNLNYNQFIHGCEKMFQLIRKSSEEIYKKMDEILLNDESKDMH